MRDAGHRRGACWFGAEADGHEAEYGRHDSVDAMKHSRFSDDEEMPRPSEEYTRF